MILSTLSPVALRDALATTGISLHLAPVTVRVRSNIADVAEGLLRFYGERTLCGEGGFADFHIALQRPRGVRRWLRPQVDFLFDGEHPFKPLPLSQAFPMFEWGLNWCLANHCHQFVILHAAVIERDGCAVVMPAPPGSGKSTLCAALACRGWRLLSDELALLSPADGLLTPTPRPVSLKNASIAVMRAFEPAAVIGPCYRDTRKGDVAHMKPPDDALVRAGERAAPRWVVLPRYEAGVDLTLRRLSRPETVVRLAENCFNYSVLGKEAFSTLSSMVDRSQCLELSYSRLDDAIAAFDRMQANG